MCEAFFLNTFHRTSFCIIPFPVGGRQFLSRKLYGGESSQFIPCELQFPPKLLPASLQAGLPAAPPHILWMEGAAHTSKTRCLPAGVECACPDSGDEHIKSLVLGKDS